MCMHIWCINKYIYRTYLVRIILTCLNVFSADYGVVHNKLVCFALGKAISTILSISQYGSFAGFSLRYRFDDVQ